MLLPVEDAAARVESAMGSIAASEVLASPALVMDRPRTRRCSASCSGRAPTSVRRRRVDARGRRVGEVSAPSRSTALIAKVAEVQAAEVIILTRKHVVAEFFHVDWTSRARRKLGVPILHLLEHENFDEQAGRRRGGHRLLTFGLATVP